MFDWLFEHGDNVSVLTDIGTLLIWLVYAQLLYFGFRRQRRPRLLINRGRKKDIDALCIISNMSAEPVFIQHIIAELETSHGVVRLDVTDHTESYDEGDEERSQDGSSSAPAHSPILRDGSHQGPLESGQFVHIDSFGKLVRRLAHEGGFELQGYQPDPDSVFHALTIRIICIYGSEDLPIGAERRFEFVEKKPGCGLVPTTWDTKRLSSAWQRRRLRKEIEKLNCRDDLSSLNTFKP